MKIAVLGIGLMGKPMVENLVAAGHELHIWNRSQHKAEALNTIATCHKLPNEAAAHAEVLITMLYDGAITSEVLIASKVMQDCPANCLVINMGSVEPERDRALAKTAISLGKRYLDAPVSGGVKGAETASLSIFVGGNPEDMDFALPIFQALGRPHYLGLHGAGQSAKLANQLIVAITIGAVAEAFQLARLAGCDLSALHKALQGGFADSRILVEHGERMIKGDYTPGGRSRSQLKDIHNAQHMATHPISSSLENKYK
ncbi:MAG: NAD(P)-dependent oxidoreductase [Gammaproteobacteria bacterium]